jgi:hypothetical protein
MLNAKRFNTGLLFHHFFDWLPHEITQLVLSHLPLDETVKCEQVCVLWHRLLEEPIFWHTKYIRLWGFNPLTEPCFSTTGYSLKRIALMRFRVEMEHCIAGSRHFVPRDPFALITWGDQLCREAEHTSNPAERSWFMFFAMQEYCSASIFAQLPDEGRDNESILFSRGGDAPAEYPEPIVIAFLRWANALREVAVGANPNDRGALEAFAEEKLSLATCFSESHVFSGNGFYEDPSASDLTVDASTNNYNFDVDIVMEDRARLLRSGSESMKSSGSDFIEGWGWGA